MQKGTGSGESLPPFSERKRVAAEAAAQRCWVLGRTSVPAVPGQGCSSACPCSARGERPGSSPGRRRSGAILSCHRCFRQQIGTVSSRKCDLDHHPFAADGGRDVGPLISSGINFSLSCFIFLPVCLFLHPFTSLTPLAEG